MYDLWCLLFSNFRQNVPIDAGRTWLYEIIHFPLHFSMLLLLLGMVNTVSLNAFAYGMVDVRRNLYAILPGLVDGVPVNSPEVQKVAMLMNRLDVTPDFEAEYAILQAMVNTTGADLEFYGYIAQVIYAACEKSSVVIPASAEALLTEMFLIEDSGPGFNESEAEMRAAELETEALTQIVSSALSGTLWLYPAAVSHPSGRDGESD